MRGALPSLTDKEANHQESLKAGGGSIAVPVPTSLQDPENPFLRLGLLWKDLDNEQQHFCDRLRVWRREASLRE